MICLQFGLLVAELTEQEMQTELNRYDADSMSLCNTQAKASWAVQTDVGNKLKEAEQVSKINIKINVMESENAFKKKQ